VINKEVKTCAEAVAGISDGATVLVAGFGAVGVADHLLDALHDQGAKELTSKPTTLVPVTTDWRN
jgi:3-oxoadipate CoA-transferase, alpha subunit